MEFERAKLEIEGPVGIVTLNHPEVMNAVSLEMLGGLMQVLEHVEDPKNGVRCLLMTGAGRGFCAGANLQPRAEGSGGPRARNAIPSVPAPSERAADAIRHGGERRRGGRRDELCADGRSGGVRAF